MALNSYFSVRTFKSPSLTSKAPITHNNRTYIDGVAGVASTTTRPERIQNDTALAPKRASHLNQMQIGCLDSLRSGSADGSVSFSDIYDQEINARGRFKFRGRYSRVIRVLTPTSW